MERSAIHLLRKRGKTLRQIAAELGHSKTTIARSRALRFMGTFALQEALWGMEHNDEKAFQRGIAAYR